MDYNLNIAYNQYSYTMERFMQAEISSIYARRQKRMFPHFTQGTTCVNLEHTNRIYH